MFFLSFIFDELFILIIKISLSNKNDLKLNEMMRFLMHKLIIMFSSNQDTHAYVFHFLNAGSRRKTKQEYKFDLDLNYIGIKIHFMKCFVNFKII
jgi:hypothetical protein